MKKLLLAVCCFLVLSSIYAQLPALQWARNIGGSEGEKVVADAAGNVYTTGHFGGTADFDPGPGTFYLTTDGADDAYVSKLDVNGDFVWAIRIGGDATNYGRSVAVDAGGNVYVAGYFSGTVDFDPGSTIFNIASNGQYDIFIAKIDASGNFIWAKNIGGNFSDLAYAMTLDLSGNICMTGVFVGEVDFDPGPGTYNLNAGGNNDCFIVRLDANGNFIQAMHIAGNYSEGDDISVDGGGNIYVCGNYNATADLDPGAGTFNVTASSGADAFVIKLNAAGGFVWGKSFGGFGTDNCKSVKADANGNVYVAGDFPFTVDFDPGPSTYNVTVAGSIDAYVLKLDVNGNFVWVSTFAGTDADAAKNIVLDPSGNVYVTGIFQSTADFDPGPAVFNLTVTGGVSNDIFICKLTSAGGFAWALHYGGNAIDEGYSLFCNASGNIYATGSFQNVVDFDPGAGTTVLNSATGRTYIVNLGSGIVMPLTLLDFSGISSATGNLLQWTTGQEINTSHFDVEWSSDGLRFTKIATQPAGNHSTSVSQYKYLHNSSVNGNNFYRLKMVDNDGQFTYSAIIKLNIQLLDARIAVFPNPVTDRLQLNIRALKKDLVTFYLYSSAGKLIASKKITILKGNNILEWDIAAASAGNYFISCHCKDYQAIKICKQ
ncbi:MAG: T9SS type A sorting domain-containing protein [Chitinophagaceae bacterium]|nr:T9SS type A sorting domain-containing protein [Chitinophagaceae bacterium]